MLEDMADHDGVRVDFVEIVDELVVVAPVFLVSPGALREYPDGRKLIVVYGVSMVYVVCHVDTLLALVLRECGGTRQSRRRKSDEHKGQYDGGLLHIQPANITKIVLYVYVASGLHP